jgi:hypothetical protein
MPRQRFLLLLEDRGPKLAEGMPDPVPAIIRLRRLVKLALRAFGFRVVDAKELPAEDATAGKTA